MKRCPICKKKLRNVEDIDGYVYGYYCKEKHYATVDDPESMKIWVGDKYMSGIYEGTIRQCRVQNMIIDRWIKQERRRYNKSK